MGIYKHSVAKVPIYVDYRTGQYYHYLTKWCGALVKMGAECQSPTYIQQAAELIEGAHSKFLTSDKKRMRWKMSIDLSRPQVLDGLCVAQVPI